MQTPIHHQKNHALDAAVLGKDSRYIDFERFERPIHKGLIPVIQSFKELASEEGFQLKLASGYRSFEQQMQIWNEKASGKRPILGNNEQPLDSAKLTATERVFAILRWTALPGTSRHHWGTDFDIFDAAAVDENYRLKLTVAETTVGGPFERFYIWINKVMEAETLSLCRPFFQDFGGVAPEPWHISYTPLANEFARVLSVECVHVCIKSSEISLKKEILKNLDEIYHRFIVNNSI